MENFGTSGWGFWHKANETQEHWEFCSLPYSNDIRFAGSYDVGAYTRRNEKLSTLNFAIYYGDELIKREIIHTELPVEQVPNLILKKLQENFQSFVIEFYESILGG